MGSDLVKRKTQGPRVIRFIESHTVHPDGHLIGQPLMLHPWWKQAITELFEVIWDEREQRWRRKYSEAYISVAKKNAKALALETPIPTPRGWTTMEDLRVGDQVFDERGAVCNVVLVSAVMFGQTCYTVRFSDGSSVVAEAGHLWRTETRKPGRHRDIWTTEQIRDSLRIESPGSSGWNHRIPVAGPIACPPADLPIPPYVLGAWLGDGSSDSPRLSCADADVELIGHICAEGVEVQRLNYPSNEGRCPLYSLGLGWMHRELRLLGILGAKAIPALYLRAGNDQRLALLQGLMDTDGTVSLRGQCSFSSSSPVLAAGFIELGRSLGLKPTLDTDDAKIRGRVVGTHYRIQFWPLPGMAAFRLQRKLDRQKSPCTRLPRSTSRHIVAVEETDSVPVRCIQVDSPSSLYLAGLGMVPTHNTTVLAALGLYFLLADGDPSAFVVSAAASEEQGANLLYGSAKVMCELSPTLKQLTTAMDKEILVNGMPRCRMRNVTSKAGTNDGLNCRAVLCDELHEWKGQRGRDVHHVLSGSVGARPDAMLINITTAGHDRDSICYEKYEYGQKVLSGEIDDPSFYYRVAEMPEEADYRDPANWPSANPLLGVSVLPSYIENRVRREPESVVRRYNCNQWVAAEDIWIGYGVWDEGLSDLDLDPSLPLYVGIDISRNIDSSALAMVQKQATTDGPRYVIRAKVWSNPYREDEPAYADWRMNNNLVVEEIRRLFKEFPVPACEIDDQVMPGPSVSFDPWRFRPEAEKLLSEGVAMVEMPQSDSRMIPASQAFFEVIMAREIAHNGDPILKRHVHSVIAEQKDRGWRISKPKGSKAKIDAAVATAIAIYNAQTEAPNSEPSVYEGRGLLVI